MDIVLAGKTAIIESIEQDYEGKIHLCVVVDDDPGRDIGLMRQPGHRFFFTLGEVEPLPPCDDDLANVSRVPRILVAGIGNIFLGDDAFGVEVVRRLSTRQLPNTVHVTDLASADMIWLTPCSTDTKQLSWWTPAHVANPRALST